MVNDRNGINDRNGKSSAPTYLPTFGRGLLPLFIPKETIVIITHSLESKVLVMCTVLVSRMVWTQSIFLNYD